MYWLWAAVCQLSSVFVVTSGNHIFWVAPDTGQCREEQIPCQTLDSYARLNSTLLSTSNAKWIFLPGNHTLTQTIIISNVHNITWTGDWECIQYAQACGRTPDMHSVPVVNVSSSDVTLGIESSTNVFISSLRFERWSKSVFFKFVDVTNLNMKHVNITANVLEISNPYGIVVLESLFTSVLQTSILKVDQSEPRMASSTHFSFRVLTSEILGSFTFGISLSQDTYPLMISMASLYVTDTQFADDIFLTFSRIHLVDIKFYNCSFGRWIWATINVYSINFLCTKCVFSNTVTAALILDINYICRCQIHIKLDDSLFVNTSGVQIFIVPLFCKNVHRYRISEKKEIYFKDVAFLNNTGNTFGADGNMHLLHVKFDPSDLAFEEFLQLNTSVVIDNCTFKHNQLFEYQVYVQEFTKATFDGHVLISHNNGSGVYVDRAWMLVRGELDIKDNIGSMQNSGLRLNDTRISYFQGAQVRIVNNEGFGVHVENEELCRPPSMDQVCFFMEVLSAVSGMNTNWNVSLLAHGNYVVSDKPENVPGNQIYNARMDNCEIMSRGDGKTREEYNLYEYVGLDAWDRTTVGSPPYKICLCDPSQPNNASRWTCDDGTVINETVYPGSELFLSLLTLGDFNFEQPAVVTITLDGAVTTTHYTQTISTCTSFPLHHTISTSEFCVTVAAKDMLNSDRIWQQRRICIRAVDHCPDGLMLKCSNHTLTCVCRDTLSSNGLNCSVQFGDRGYFTRFMLPNSRAWLGYRNGELMFSNVCPAHYCSAGNSSLFTTGLALEDLGSSLLCHPLTNRHGFLCSQCLPGYSSQLGSFQCRKCSSFGLLYLGLAAISGLGLIAFLFLFNFTVVQGDIVGISFFANIVGVFDSFLLQHAPKPFYVVLSALNLKWGMGTCIVHGMDEFVVSILNFLFPLYLLTLTIAIIIAAHKFNLKIFRVRFIARRSVPVLATLMLQTYSGLVNAVIFGLQYSTVYSVDSGEEHVVWSPQPELEYFRGKHIAVGVLCLLVALFYLLPFTIVTLFGDLFRMCSHNLWYSHFMDVFHGAFRYPFGFWFGSRLLMRIMFIVISLTTSTSTLAYSLFFTMGALLLLQFLLEPFRTDNITLYKANAHSRSKFRELLKVKMSEIFRPKIIDSLYLLNIMLISAAIFGSSGVSATTTSVGVCLSVSVALVDLFAVTLHHGYHYFPLPERVQLTLYSLPEKVIRLRQTVCRKLLVRRIERPLNAEENAVEVTYLSASMCFREDENGDGSGDDCENRSGNE